MGEVAPGRPEALREAMHQANDAMNRDPNDLAKREAARTASADYYLALHPEDIKWRRREAADELPSVEEIRDRAAVADRANRAIRLWGRIDPRPEHHDTWAAQLAWFEEMLGQVFTDRFNAAETAVKAGDRSGLEYCVRFLEADPWCFGSGYAKEGLIPAIVRFDLDDDTRERLARAVLTVVDDVRPRREIRRYGTLAKAVASADLRTKLERRTAALDRQVRYNANKVLEAFG